MKIKDIQKEKSKRTGFISARVKPENAKWYKKNKIDLDKLIDELKDANGLNDGEKNG